MLSDHAAHMIKLSFRQLAELEDDMESLIEMSVLACLFLAFVGPFVTNMYRRLRRPEKKESEQAMTTTES